LAEELDDEFTEDAEEPEDLDVVDLDELEEDDLGDDELDDDATVVDDADEAVVPKDGAAAPAAAATDEDEDEEEDDEVLDPDDVEASLDVILKDRLVVEDEEEEEDEEPPDPAESAEGTGRIMPRRPGEFVCQSCFLVKHPSQLEDPKRMFCRDCV